MRALRRCFASASGDQTRRSRIQRMILTLKCTLPTPTQERRERRPAIEGAPGPQAIPLRAARPRPGRGPRRLAGSREPTRTRRQQHPNDSAAPLRARADRWRGCAESSRFAAYPRALLVRSLSQESVVDTSSREGFPDPIGMPDGAQHDWRDQRLGAVLQPAGTSRVSGLVQCRRNDGYGPNGQC